MITGPIAETQVRQNVFAWTLGGDSIHASYGTNCVAVVGPDAVLLVDPLIAPAHARLVEAALREKTSAPVRIVALTHHHTDHTLGASWFAQQGAAVIAHRACRERMAAVHPALIESRRRGAETADLFADAVPVLPTVTFEGGLTLHIGDAEVEIWHPGWGHTPGDAFLFLPEERVAICGDLLFCGHHYNYEDASIPGVREGLRALRALDADTFIPGHGPVSGAGALEEQARYHDTVEAIVREGVANGLDDEALLAGVRERFPDYRLTVVIPSAIARFTANGA
jgi:cyclase